MMGTQWTQCQEDPRWRVRSDGAHPHMAPAERILADYGFSIMMGSTGEFPNLPRVPIRDWANVDHTRTVRVYETWTQAGLVHRLVVYRTTDGRPLGCGIR